MAPRFNPKDLRAIFEHHVLRMLLSRGKITRDLIALIRSCENRDSDHYC